MSLKIMFFEVLQALIKTSNYSMLMDIIFLFKMSLIIKFCLNILHAYT